MEDQITTEPTPKKRSSWGKIGILFSTLAMVIFVCAFGYGYFQLAKVNLSLAQTVSDVSQQISHSQNEIADLKKSINDLQQASQKNQELAAQQERLMADWKTAQQGNVDKWRLAEAHYLVKLADDQLQLNKNIAMAIALLQRADQALQTTQDSAFLEIRKSVTADIARLQTIPDVDVTNLYLHLTSIDTHLDELPLPVNPLNADQQKKDVPLSSDASWWKAGLERGWRTLSQFVVIRNTGSTALPLVLPDEKNFLFQNLHAQIQYAMWGLLHRNAEVYQASLGRAVSWIQQYFVQDAPQTKAMLASLLELQKVNVQPQNVDLSATLKLFPSDTSAG